MRVDRTLSPKVGSKYPYKYGLTPVSSAYWRPTWEPIGLPLTRKVRSWLQSAYTWGWRAFVINFRTRRAAEAKVPQLPGLRLSLDWRSSPCRSRRRYVREELRHFTRWSRSWPSNTGIAVCCRPPRCGCAGSQCVATTPGQAATSVALRCPRRSGLPGARAFGGGRPEAMMTLCKTKHTWGNGHVGDRRQARWIRWYPKGWTLRGATIDRCSGPSGRGLTAQARATSSPRGLIAVAWRRAKGGSIACREERS